MKTKITIITIGLFITANFIFTNVVSAQGLACGSEHTLVLCNNNTIMAWGRNIYGEIGTGVVSTNGCECIDEPVAVTAISNVRGVAAGHNSSLVLKNDGTVWYWGRITSTISSLTPVQISGLSNVVEISANFLNYQALLSDGTVKTWGYNEEGQLGNGTFNESQNIPVSVTGLTGVVKIACGGARFMIALKSDGTVWSWGANSSGQLGDGTNTLKSTPVQVIGLTNIISISAGSSEALALKSDGTVYRWGNGINTPEQILTNGVAIGCGDLNTFVTRSDGTVWGWSDQNEYGQLGNGTTSETNTPVQLATISNAVAMDGGDWHSAFMFANGTVKVCGWGIAGHIGDGTGATRLTPVLPTGLCYVTTAIDEEDKNLPASVYPNPAANNIIIETESGKGIYNLQDVTGKLLLSGNITSAKFNLDMSTLSKGIYLLSLTDGEQMAHRKIVKE